MKQQIFNGVDIIIFVDTLMKILFVHNNYIRPSGEEARVDFYDVDGKLYFGEITFHHGSGFDQFTPAHYDEDYGKLMGKLK